MDDVAYGVRIVPMRLAGPMAQPTRHPVTLNSFPPLYTEMHRSHIASPIRNIFADP